MLAEKVFSLPWVWQIHAPTDGRNAWDVLDSAVELSLIWGKPRRLDGEAAGLKGIHVIGIKHVRACLSMFIRTSCCYIVGKSAEDNGCGAFRWSLPSFSCPGLPDFASLKAGMCMIVFTWPCLAWIAIAVLFWTWPGQTSQSPEEGGLARTRPMREST